MTSWATSLAQRLAFLQQSRRHSVFTSTFGFCQIAPLSIEHDGQLSLVLVIDEQSYLQG